MAVFFKAEAGEALRGRAPDVVSAYLAAAQLSLQNDDELFGCLCAWNAVHAITSSGKPYLLGDVLRWHDTAYDSKHKLVSWHGYVCIEGRTNVLKPMKTQTKVSLTA